VLDTTVLRRQSCANLLGLHCMLEDQQHYGIWLRYPVAPGQQTF
jgi:hypothetical protein